MSRTIRDWTRVACRRASMALVLGREASARASVTAMGLSEGVRVLAKTSVLVKELANYV